jgi:hypothetical protein
MYNAKCGQSFLTVHKNMEPCRDEYSLQHGNLLASVLHISLRGVDMITCYLFVRLFDDAVTTTNIT